MKTTKKQFELFMSECKKWADKFELNNWRFDFVLCDIGKSQARMESEYKDCVAAIKFDTEIKKSVNRTYDEVIKDSAKHEMLHVLVANYDTLAASRFVTADELDKANEELVRKLEKIII